VMVPYPPSSTVISLLFTISTLPSKQAYINTLLLIWYIKEKWQNCNKASYFIYLHIYGVYWIMLSVAETLQSATVRWLINSEECLGMWSWPDVKYYPVLSWMVWGKPQKAAIRTACLWIKIWTCKLPNIR